MWDVRTQVRFHQHNRLCQHQWMSALFVPILCVSLFSLFLLQYIHFTTQAIVRIDCCCCYALHHKVYQNLQRNINKDSVISSLAGQQRHKSSHQRLEHKKRRRRRRMKKTLYDVAQYSNPRYIQARVPAESKTRFLSTFKTRCSRNTHEHNRTTF